MERYNRFKSMVNIKENCTHYAWYNDEDGKCYCLNILDN